MFRNIRHLGLGLAVGALLLQGCSSGGGGGGSNPTNPSSSAGTSSSSSQPNASSMSSQSSASTPNFEAGKNSFAANCSACHSDNGNGTFTGALIGPSFDVNNFQYPSMMYQDKSYTDGSVEELSLFIYEVMGPLTSNGLSRLNSLEIAQYLWSYRSQAGSSSSSSEVSSIPSSSEPSSQSSIGVSSSVSSVQSSSSSAIIVSSTSSSSSSLPPSSSSVSTSSSSIPSSSSSVSSSSVPVSSSSSSSSSAGDRADVEEFVTQVGGVSRSINPEISNLYQFGGFLSGDTKAKYDSFIGEMNASPALNWELSRVVGRLTPVLTEIAVKFLNQWVADGALPSNPNIVVSDGSIVEELFDPETFDSGAVYRLGYSEVLNGCAEPVTNENRGKCEVNVNVGVDITAYALGGTVNPIALNMKNLKVNFTTLEASNDYVEVKADSAALLDAHLTGNVVSVRAEYEGSLDDLGLDSLTSAVITLGNVNFEVPLTVTEKQVTEPFTVSAAISGGLQMRATAAPSTSSIDGYTVTTFPLQFQSPTLNLSSDIGLNITKGQNSMVASVEDVQVADATNGAFGVDLLLNDCTGEGCPAAFDFELVGETPQSFLDMAAKVDVTATLDGAAPVSVSTQGRRNSDTTVALENLVVAFDGFTLQDVDMEYDDEGSLVSLLATSEEGYVIQVQTIGGVRSGSVEDASSTQIAEIRDEAGVLKAYFNNGTEIEL